MLERFVVVNYFLHELIGLQFFLASYSLVISIAILLLNLELLNDNLLLSSNLDGMPTLLLNL